MLTVFGAANLKAQQMNNDKNNYVVISKKVPQSQSILLTAEALKTEDGQNFVDFQVII